MLSFIDCKDILDESVLFYAHFNDDKKESLQEHIIRCEKYFQKLYEDKNVEMIVKRFHHNMHFIDEKASYDVFKDLLIQLVTFHDFGKINPAFQRVKMKNRIGKDYEGLKGQNHSFLSSIIYIDYFLDKLNRNNEICSEDKRLLENFILEHAYIIAQHHSDLDHFTKFHENLKSSQTKQLINHLKSTPIKGYKGLLYIDYKKLNLLIRHFYSKDQKHSSYEYSFKYFYYRLAYSLLVASDYYATSEFMNQKEYDIIGDTLSIQDFQNEYNQSELLMKIRDYEMNKYQENDKDFDRVSDINDLRSELFLDAERNLLKHLDKPIYFLEAPTGSGKSNTAFNLSFHLMQNRKKLFYIYPFNTLVEQNKNNLNNIFTQQQFQNQIVVVNSLTPLPQKQYDQEDSKDYYQKLLLDRQFLNYPVILSTHVSLFNLLFGFKKEDIIGFHQLSDSVIVLDEIQSYKNQIWAEIIIMLKYCAELMNMKLIIMSATLPNLEELSGQSHIIEHLLPNSYLYYEHPLFKNRVQLHYELLNEKISLEELKNILSTIKNLIKKS